MRSDRNHSILVVDDDPHVLEFLTHILSNANYAVVMANSGAAALQILNERRVSLVILDLQMPPPDGFEVLKALRSTHPSLKILVTSAFMNGALLKASELVGATASLA